MRIYSITNLVHFFHPVSSATPPKMHFATLFATVAAVLFSSSIVASPLRNTAQQTYAGYLISTFSDVNPKVQLYLSDGNSPTKFYKLNQGKEVLASTVGTKGVRDIYLTSNDARTQWYMIATGMTLVEYEWQEDCR